MSKPNYGQIAQQQAGANMEVTAMQNYMNRPNQKLPEGEYSWSYQQITDPTTGKVMQVPTQTYTPNETVGASIKQQQANDLARASASRDVLARVASTYGTDPTEALNALPGIASNLQGAHQLIGNVPNNISGGKSLNELATSATSSVDPTTQTTNALNFSADRKRIEDAAFNRMQPQHDRQQAALDTQLANSGITRGSAAYKQAMQDLGDQQSRERFDAMQYGGTEQQRMQQQLMGQQQQAYEQALQSGNFANQAKAQQLQNLMAGGNYNFQQQMQDANFAAQARQQALSELITKRNLSMNEYNALMNGLKLDTPNQPTFQSASKADAADYLGAAKMQGDQTSSMIGGLMGMGAKAATM